MGWEAEAPPESLSTALSLGFIPALWHLMQLLLSSLLVLLVLLLYNLITTISLFLGLDGDILMMDE